MLRPSYAELMEVLNRETEGDEEITSRYTIVIATAKRARQLINGDEPMVSEKKGKPVSTAVEELYQGKIKVVPEGKGTIVNSNVNIESEELDNINSSESGIEGIETYTIDNFFDNAGDK